MHGSEKYVLTVSVYRPSQSRVQEGKGASIGIDIVEAAEPTQQDHGADDPLILRYAAGVLVNIGVEMIHAEHVLRVDLAKSAKYPGSWPAVCETRRDLQACVDAITNSIEQTRHRGLYPLSVWGLPERSQREAERATDAFGQLPADSGLLAQIIALRVARIAVFPSSMTLSVNPDTIEEAVKWVRSATASGPLSVEWS